MNPQGDLVAAGCVPHQGASFVKRLLPANPAVRWFLRVLNRLENGRLTVIVPGGEKHEIVGKAGSGGLEATLVLRRARAISKILIGGDVGFAEAYMDGDWDTPDLSALFLLAACNKRALGNDVAGLSASTVLRRVRKLARSNTLRGSRRNIAYHYDLGNDFYRRWLDETMTYSSAFFEHDGQSLTDAQTAKYRRLVEMLDLKKEHHLLEIGCGWGGLAEYAATEIGCRVTAITLSRSQFDYAHQRISQAGLADLVELRLQDYRQVEGTFDRIASIEMIEAVGERNWPLYFRTLRDRLRPGGIAALQAITINDARFDHYRRRPDFIQEYIFPGGMLPSKSCLADRIADQGLRLADSVEFGASYARTLALWADAFGRRWPEIRQLGFDARFKRMWDYYLAYCEAGFRTGATDVVHLRIERD